MEKSRSSLVLGKMLAKFPDAAFPALRVARRADVSAVQDEPMVRAGDEFGRNVGR